MLGNHFIFFVDHRFIISVILYVYVILMVGLIPTYLILAICCWFLQIHLLTGIGRFSEMTYVFDMLKQKHQFELLFRKGIERVR